MPLIEVDQLTYRYPDGTLALEGVGFRLDPAERVGLVGPNGAGKSTLLWHLNGLLPERLRGRGRQADRNGHSEQSADGVPAAGHGRSDLAGVRVDGMEVCSGNLALVRRTVGLVFQDPDDQLFSPTVADDVAFGPLNLGLSQAEARLRVRASLAAVGLEGYGERLPHHLSVGERKRVCLAGVLACEPRLLALDEPTANLDPRARRGLIGVLRGLDCALLIASHDLELILELCSRVILLDRGRIHADGPIREVLSDEDLLLAHGLELPLTLRLAALSSGEDMSSGENNRGGAGGAGG
ncbi:MAG: energy-coupling factor ABC transporter ATP-binding protein [Pirellulales bacterium]